MSRYTVCRACKSEVRVIVPAGGDGSVDVHYRHNDPSTGERCRESRQIVETTIYNATATR